MNLPFHAIQHHEHDADADDHVQRVDARQAEVQEKMTASDRRRSGFCDREEPSRGTGDRRAVRQVMLETSPVSRNVDDEEDELRMPVMTICPMRDRRLRRAHRQHHRQRAADQHDAC